MSDPSVPTTPRGWRARLMPLSVTPWVRAMGLASLLANIVLVITGGLVRLTSSGLGCPTWPRCSADSWTNVPAMGIHGYIEFGNRTLTFVLVIIAVLTWLSVLKIRTSYSDLYRLSVIMALSIPVQAVVGGISVRFGLNPWIVGVHYFLSAAIIMLSAIFWARARRYSLAEVRSTEDLEHVSADRTKVALGWCLAVVGTILIYLGTLVTGTGQHAGDASSARHAFNPMIVARLHAAPAWLTVILAVAITVLAVRRGWPKAIRRSVHWLGMVLVLQGLIGYIQYFTGSPSGLVWLHLAGSGLAIWAITSVVERLVVLGRPDSASRALDRVHGLPDGVEAEQLATTRA